MYCDKLILKPLVKTTGNKQQVTGIKLTQRLRYEVDDEVVLTQIILAMSTVAHVEQAKVERRNWVVWRIGVVLDWHNVPAVTDV